MSHRDPRVTAYIANAEDFAKPILEHLRTVVHQACPEVRETMKWRFCAFEYKGILCTMAAFKAHCAFGFWDDAAVGGDAKEGAMGQLGRITSLKDLPPKRVLAGYVKKAVELKDAGARPAWAAARAERARRPEPPLPEELAAALAMKRHTKAKQVWDAFPPSHRKEYIGWIEEAKRPETRARRTAQALEWIAEGKGRNWKYEGKAR